ncbi:hypothetical protein Tco_0799213 [Tanacetum coccineum]
METEEISERYVTPCFVNGLEAYDGEINLENDKNLISNEFAVKLCMEHEVKNGHKVGKKELIVALRGEVYFVKFIINPEKDDIEPGVVLGRSFLRLTKGIADFGNEIITIYPDLDPFNDESDKTNDPGDDWVAILEGIDFGDIPEINGLELHPFMCNMGKRREEVKHVSNKIIMLDRSKSEPMGILRDVLCQVGVTTILARFLSLDMPMYKDVPIVLGRSFLHTCGGIINTIKGTTSTFDGICHKKFYVVAVKNKQEEKDSDDEEE